MFRTGRGTLWPCGASVILGSTGSVGTQALDVVRRNPDRFKVVGLSAGTNQELLVGQIREFLPPVVAIADEEAAGRPAEKLSASIKGAETPRRARRPPNGWPATPKPTWS